VHHRVRLTLLPELRELLPMCFTTFSLEKRVGARECTMAMQSCRILFGMSAGLGSPFPGRIAL
jgi:hypothetical protein